MARGLSSLLIGVLSAVKGKKERWTWILDRKRKKRNLEPTMHLVWVVTRARGKENREDSGSHGYNGTLMGGGIQA